MVRKDGALVDREAAGHGKQLFMVDGFHVQLRENENEDEVHMTQDMI